MAKILIVDDANFSRRALRAVLEPAGHEIVEASSGLAALEQYALSKPDLVLLDLTMPDLNGLEVLKRLRELDPAARVIVASADIQSGTQAEARELGACAYLTKPFHPATVLTTVQTQLETPPHATTDS